VQTGLADQVVPGQRDLVEPGMLKLGGTKKRMTAMFTDIRGFSTISEKLTPEDLVRLLNRYLTGMSDAILDLKGTIDKYEGDAIIGFFGAPIDLPDHAVRACTAALKMKRIEAELNQQFLADKIAPAPLLTRLGINTGDMVVGNMGTDRKMDYTIIGDAVNLAARLEGVNKQYGTWICVSEETMRAAGNGFVYRKLDKIRVVGKMEPIQIFELVDELSTISREAADFFDEFAEAMRSFESREWQTALDRFKSLSEKRPADGPSRLYIGRCEAYLQEPPPEDWDGVFNLTSK
jgi:adenylate cyclase